MMLDNEMVLDVDIAREEHVRVARRLVDGASRRRRDRAGVHQHAAVRRGYPARDRARRVRHRVAREHGPRRARRRPAAAACRRAPAVTRCSQQITFLDTRDLTRTCRLLRARSRSPAGSRSGSCRIYHVSGTAYVGFCQRADAPVGAARHHPDLRDRPGRRVVRAAQARGRRARQGACRQSALSHLQRLRPGPERLSDRDPALSGSRFSERRPAARTDGCSRRAASRSDSEGWSRWTISRSRFVPARSAGSSGPMAPARRPPST